jgi:hypothetical protein
VSNTPTSNQAAGITTQTTQGTVTSSGTTPPITYTRIDTTITTTIAPFGGTDR